MGPNGSGKSTPARRRWGGLLRPRGSSAGPTRRPEDLPDGALGRYERRGGTLASSTGAETGLAAAVLDEFARNRERAQAASISGGERGAGAARPTRGGRAGCCATSAGALERTPPKERARCPAAHRRLRRLDSACTRRHGLYGARVLASRAWGLRGWEHGPALAGRPPRSPRCRGRHAASAWPRRGLRRARARRRSPAARRREVTTSSRAKRDGSANGAGASGAGSARPQGGSGWPPRAARCAGRPAGLSRGTVGSRCRYDRASCTLGRTPAGASREGARGSRALAVALPRRAAPAAASGHRAARRAAPGARLSAPDSPAAHRLLSEQSWQVGAAIARGQLQRPQVRAPPATNYRASAPAMSGADLQHGIEPEQPELTTHRAAIGRHDA